MPGKQVVLFLVIAASTLSGCITNKRPSAIWPQTRPLGADIPTYKAPPQLTSPSDERGQVPSNPTGKLALGQALAAALMHNPKLASVSYDVRIKEAQALQAGLLPNPEIELVVEEFGGAGSRSQFSGAQTTLQLSQLIEMGGKRSARVRLSKLEGSLAAWDYEIRRLEVFVETTLAFIDVLTAQQQLRLAQETHTLSAQIYGTVAERVKSGKVSPIEKIKAAIERANAKITLENAKRNLTASGKRLIAMWGSSSIEFDRAVGELDAVDVLPPLQDIEQLVSQNPEVARWATEMEHRLAALALARAQRVPNLTASAGVQRFNTDNDTAFVVGLSMPLPVFNRNQGGILEARYRIAKARADSEAAKIRTHAAIAESYEFLAASRTEAITLKDEVLPAAHKAFDAARRGYKQGKFGYLEVLDAQRTFFETRARYTVVLASYHRGVAILESLIATGLQSVNLQPENNQKDQNHDN